MKSVRAALEILCYAVPAGVVLWSWRRQKWVAVDHVFLFSAGFTFYFVVPFTLGRTEFFSYDQGMYVKWRALFDVLADSTWVLYFAVSLALYTAFVAGDLVAARWRTGAAWAPLPVDNRAIRWMGVFGVIVAALHGLPLYGYFFVGYSVSTQIPALGTFTAATILVLSVAVITTVLACADGTPIARALRNPFVYAYALFSALLISMGGRLIILSSILMGVVFYTTYVRRLRLAQVAGMFAMLVVCSQAVLLIREPRLTALLSEWSVGVDRGSWWTALTLPLSWNAWQVFSESFNVSYSLLDFLTTYSFPLLRAPLTLLSGLTGLVPSVIFPSKSRLVVDFQQLGYAVDSPAGGMHVFVSLMVGFGLIGALAFVFLLGFGLRSLHHAPGPLYTSMYVMLCGWLGMMFFRDLQQVVIKEMLEFSILVSLVIAAASRWIVRARAPAMAGS